MGHYCFTPKALNPEAQGKPKRRRPRRRHPGSSVNDNVLPQRGCTTRACAKADARTCSLTSRHALSTSQLLGPKTTLPRIGLAIVDAGAPGARSYLRVRLLRHDGARRCPKPTEGVLGI